MDLNYTPEQLRFRDEVRSFLAAYLPREVSERALNGAELTADDFRNWQRTLHAKGWGASSWPVEFGGTGWGCVEQYLFDVECALAGAPGQVAFGVKMVAPVIMRFGSPAQQKYYLPRILNGDHWWCQGYSEPGAGSDLASLKTQAVRDGDHYVVNGQKAWNTLGQHADWIFCLVRSDPTVKPQRGISFLLVDMQSPGVTVKPTRLLDGSYEVNEVWFDNVRVPVANRVGEENQGWTYAKYLLGHERTNIAGIGGSRCQLQRLKRIAAAQIRAGVPLLQDSRFRARLAEIEIDLMALEITNMRVILANDKHGGPGATASILKVRGTEIYQAISELMLDAIGIRALAFGPRGVNEPRLTEPSDTAGVTAQYLNLRKVSIFGGSNEIQKNIIAQMILGL